MTPRQIEYRAYLKTDHWKELRAEVLNRDGCRCVHCQKKKGCLHVHHRFYRSRFEDSIADDLITLCERCHKVEHGLAKPKKIKAPKQPKKIKGPGGVLYTGVPKNLRDVNLMRSNGRIDRATFEKLRIQFGGVPKLGQPRKVKMKRWWPGMYEGKLPGELRSR